MKKTKLRELLKQREEAKKPKKKSQTTAKRKESNHIPKAHVPCFFP